LLDSEITEISLFSFFLPPLRKMVLKPNQDKSARNMADKLGI
jgi:hypothetical protein